MWMTSLKLVGRHGLLCLLLSLAGAGAVQTPACQESGYCSVGTSKPWTGDIRESSALKDMLQHVAYKRELILTIFQEEGDPVWVEQVQQLHHELYSMGYAHHFFITLDEQACKVIQSVTLNCIWDSSDLPSYVLGGETALWHNRWKFIARASRLGYNVMSVDTDFIFFRDPYLNLKRPPLSEVQMLGAPEGGSNYNCNGGYMYVQNVRPDGPVSWVFKNIVMSTLRRADDKFNYMSQWAKGSHMNCLTFDQSIVHDALCAAGVGRPVFPVALASCKRRGNFTSRTGKRLSFKQIEDNVNALVAQHQRVVHQKALPDADWLLSLGFKQLPAEDVDYVIGNLTVPNLSYGYPEELGGRFAPPEPGPLSTAWTNMLKSDCPECPWWPEHRPLPGGRDTLDQLLGPDYDKPQVTLANMNIFHDPSVKPEVYAQAPRWVEGSLAGIRRGWYLGPRAPTQGPQVMAHIHSWHMQSGRPHKAMLRKVLGRYNWTLGEQYAKAAGHSTPYLMRGPVKRVLALSPQIDLARTRKWSELSSIIVGLLQAARLSGRVALLPNLPCETAWLHDRERREDPAYNRTLCVAPTFWRDLYRFPLPVTVAVDERGELVGGWARRLLHQDQQQPAGRGVTRPHVHSRLPEVAPLLLDPLIPGEERSSISSQSHRRSLQEEEPTASVTPDWWAQQQYAAVLPQLWDATCAREMHGIIMPEFFHWLKYDSHAKGVELQPSSRNTVLLPVEGDSKLQLQPPPPPGTTDSASVPRGTVVLPSKELGWSLVDIQASLPALEVYEELERVADVPLVYLGHPIMAVHDHTHLQPGQDKQEQAQLHLRQLLQQGEEAGRMQAPLTADEIIERIDKHIRRSKCKAVWTQPETHQGTVVDLQAGHPAHVVGGRVTTV